MIHRLLIPAVALMLSAGVAAQPGLSPEARLKRAMQLEQVDGDLAGAARAYQEIVDRHPDRRAVAAQALVRMGGINERLGRIAEALTAYKRIEKEYPDTEAAATARGRLAGLATTQARETVLWSGPEVGDVYSISPDGRQLAYLDMSASFSVAIRDLASGTNRIIARGSSAAWAEEVVFSADGSQVAYSWARNDAPGEVRIVNVTGGEPRVVSTIAKGWITLYDWSKDGRWIAVQMSPPGMINQHVVINVADGSHRVLKTVDRYAATEGMAFSPDSRYLAYDRPSDHNVADRDVFLLPVAGGAEVPAATGPGDQAVAGWSPDGRSLLIQTSDGETRTLTAQPIASGAPAGSAVTLRRGMSGWPLSMTAAGGLLIRVNENPTAIYSAMIDARTGGLAGVSSRLVAGETNRRPRFSRDGGRVAFLSAPGGRVLSMQRLDTGQRTVLSLPLRTVGNYDWSPDGGSFLAQAVDLQGRQGIFQIDAASGQVTLLLRNSDTARYFTPHWAGKGRRFYYSKGFPLENRGELIERDLEGGTERVVFEWSKARTVDGSTVPGLRDNRVSPDGRHVVGLTGAPQAQNGATIWIGSLADRSAKPLLALPAATCCLPIIAYNGLEWTADSRAVIINRAGGTPDGKRELWVVPIDDPAPRQLALDQPLPSGPNAMHETAAIHPDGRRIAFVSGTPRSREIRLLEDFLPVSNRRR